MKQKGKNVLFIVIIAIFVGSTIIIPLSSMLGSKSKTSAPTEDTNPAVEGKIVKEGDIYYLDTNGIKFMSLKDGKVKIDKYLNQNVRIRGDVETDQKTGAIIMAVNEIQRVD